MRKPDEIIEEAKKASIVKELAKSPQEQPVPYDVFVAAIQLAQREAIDEIAEKTENAIKNDSLMGDRYELAERTREFIEELKNQVG